MSAMKIKKGDMVKVIAGKDKNKEGKSSLQNNKDGKVLLRESTCPQSIRNQAQRIRMVVSFIRKATLDVSKRNASADGKATRVGFKMDGDKKVWFCKINR